MEKKNKNQIRSEQTRERLINKLAEIIRNGEIDSFNIRGLCSELGLSPRTFYLYFKSKEHAINQCYIFQEEIFVTTVTEKNKKTADPWERLMNIFTVGFHITETEFVTVQRRLISTLRVYDEYINGSDTAFFKMVTKELESCISEKNMTFTLSAGELARELIMFYRGLVYNHMIAHGNLPILEDGIQRIRRYAGTFIKTIGDGKITNG